MNNVINQIYDLEKEIYIMTGSKGTPTLNMKNLRLSFFGTHIEELSFLSKESRDRYLVHLASKIEKLLWKFRGEFLADDLGL